MDAYFSLATNGYNDRSSTTPHPEFTRLNANDWYGVAELDWEYRSACQAAIKA